MWRCPLALGIASRLRPRNINQALVWLLVSVMVPLLLGALALLEAQWREDQQLAQNQLLALAETLVHAVDGELEHGRIQLEVIAASSLIDTADWRQLHRFAADVARRRPGSLITLVGPDGRGLLNTGVPWGEPLSNLWQLGEENRTANWNGNVLPLSSQGMTRRVFETGEAAYSDLYFGVHVQEPRLALAVPVIREGRVRYALVMAFEPALLEQLIRSAVKVPALRVVLVDRRGIVVASNGAAASRMGDAALPLPVSSGAGTGIYQTEVRDGALVRGAYATSADTGFMVRASMPLQGRFWPGRGSFSGWVMLVLGALVASVLLAAFMGRRLAQPLQHLAQRTRGGDPPPDAPASGLAEIDALTQALRAGAAAERERHEEHVLRVTAQQQEAAVKFSEARLKRVLDQLFVFVGVLDIDGRLVEGNSIPLRRAGIRSEDVMGKPFWDCYWWNHDDAVVQQVRQAVARAAQGEVVRMDVRGRFDGGELLAVDLQLAPLRDEEGRITNVIASGVDVEARVAALRDLERSQADAVESARRFDAEHRMLQATLAAAPVGVAMADRQGQIVHVNEAASQLLGIAGTVNFDQASRSLRAWKHTPGGREPMPLLSDQWPLPRAFAERRTVTSILDVAPADGSVRRRTMLISAAPVLDAAGEVIAGVLVAVDITKRVQAEAALRRADRQKDEFLATLAHELRNPLAPIRTAVELIARSNPAEATVQRAQHIIERQVMHLARLVDDLLDVSRISFGTIELRQEVLDLGGAVASAVESVVPALDTAGLTLEQRISASPVRVRGDVTRLVQCVLNLVNNAIKFTPRGGRIVLRMEQEGSTAVVEVSDNGNGIQSENLERIFELFAQERRSGMGGNTGMGIGLALTRKLVELQGGTVRATSAGPGRGSTFRIELPAVTAPGAARPAPDPSASAVNRAGARVLVVDDNRDAADTLGDVLGLSGFAVATEYSGEAAVLAVQQESPDAVLLDIGLPDIDGYEVCRRIRRLNLARQPALIALTGWGQQQDRDRSALAGFNAHVTKPAEPARILALLAELMPERVAG